MKIKKKGAKGKKAMAATIKKYNKGGKLSAAAKKNREEKALTNKGGKQVADAELGAERSASRAASIREAKANIAASNANLADLAKEYKALTPEERKGEKGKALKEKMRTEKDAKRGNAKYDSDLATNVQGKVRIIGKALKV